MKKIIIFTILSSLICLEAFSQVNLDNQVIVYFATGVQRIAPANTTCNITSTNILNTLNNYGIPNSNVVPSFPTFNESDTVNSEVGEVSRQMNRAKVFTITVTNANTKANLIATLNNLSEVLYAESNGTISNNIIPIDGRFNQQWGMRNTVVPGADIHLDGATNIFTGNPNSIIAIIDNGVNIVHNDLNAKIIGGDNGFQIGFDGLGRQISHGSHVAGIAAAVSNNAGNNGVAGVDWAARIHSKNIFDGNGDPDITTSIIDAVNFNANVWTLNNSWGTRNPDNSPNRYSVTIRSAFAQAYRNNRVSCIAMGNHQVVFPDVPAFPASINSGVIAVGATNINDQVTGFSARGVHIDVSAPGDGIWSTNFNNNYIDLSGTSMATPHVAGLASLLKGFNTNLANDDIEQIIRLSADDRGAAGFDNAFGTGRINAERALQFLQAPNTVQHLSTTGGAIVNTSSTMTRVFLGVPGLADAAYFVKRSEVRTNITFPLMCNLIGVWGRGVGTTGFREENGRNFGEGICEVVPGTLTNTSATLRTWIYEVWTASGQNVGFFPRNANNVVFQYTILGVAAPSQIIGDASVCTTSGLYTVQNLPAGSTVVWSVDPTGVVQINTPNSIQTTLTRLTNGVITLTATVTNGCGTGAIVITKPNIVIGTVITGSYLNPNFSGGVLHSGQSVCAGTIKVSINEEPATTYSWQIIYGSAPFIDNGANIDITLTPNENVSFEVTATSSCGSSGRTVNFIADDPQCGSGGGFFTFSVSPNPVKGSMNVIFDKPVKADENIKMRLYAMNNFTIVKQWNLQGGQKQYSLNKSGVKSGHYILEAAIGNSKMSKQVIIE